MTIMNSTVSSVVNSVTGKRSEKIEKSQVPIDLDDNRVAPIGLDDNLQVPLDLDDNEPDISDAVTNYYFKFCTDTLKVHECGVKHYHKCFQPCCFCRAGGKQRGQMMANPESFEKIGFLHDQVDSPDHLLRDLAAKLLTLLDFILVDKINGEYMLKFFHHINVSYYTYSSVRYSDYVESCRRIDEWLAFYVQHGTVWNHRLGLEGGKGEGKAEKKTEAKAEVKEGKGKGKKKEKKSRRSFDPDVEGRISGEKPLVINTAPIAGNVLDGVPPAGGAESRGGVPRESNPPRGRGGNRGRGRGGNRPNDRNGSSGRKGTRVSAANNAIANSVRDSNSEQQGKIDSLYDKIEELKENAKAKEVEIEVEVANVLNMTEAINGDSTQACNNFDSFNLNIRARPACNVGVRYKPILVGGWNILWVLALALFFGCVGILVCLSYLIFISLFFLPAWYFIVPVALLQGVLAYFTIRSLRKCVSRMTLGRKVYTQIFTEAVDSGNYWEYGTIDVNGKIMDLRPSDIKIGSANLSQVVGVVNLSGPIRAAVGEAESLGFNEPVQIVKKSDTYNWIDGRFGKLYDVHGGVVAMKRDSTVSMLTTYMLALPTILFSHKPVTLYVGSYTAKEFAKSAPDRKIDAFVYTKNECQMLYDVHTYHNATTYSSVSSQISEETNYSILYRKISRYTEINVNRFGEKDLQTNAETLSRLKYFGIREAYPNFLSRQHF